MNDLLPPNIEAARSRSFDPAPPRFRVGESVMVRGATMRYTGIGTVREVYETNTGFQYRVGIHSGAHWYEEEELMPV